MQTRPTWLCHYAFDTRRYVVGVTRVRDHENRPRRHSRVTLSARRALRARAVALAVVATILVGVLVSCGTDTGRATSPGPDNNDSTQQAYQVKITSDRGQLIDGYVYFPVRVTAQVGATSRFSVLVCAAEAAECAPKGAAHMSTGPTSTTREALKIGARIRARLTADSQCEITLTSTEVQPVLLSTDSAVWTWNIKPNAVGQFTLTVHLTALVADSDEPLLPDREVTAPVEVPQTASNVVINVGRGVRNVLLTIGAILGALGLSATALWSLAGKGSRDEARKSIRSLRARRRRPRQAPKKRSSPPPS